VVNGRRTSNGRNAAPRSAGAKRRRWWCSGNSPTPYYSTLAHEQTHWTSKPSRCDRQLGKRFGDNAYAAEELIAEVGAAFLCAHLGLSTEPREDHAQYIQSWLRVLNADKRAIFTAASKAQQASDWMVKQAHAAGSVKGVAA
jgi:antirestriction protein ArdC